jgi:hypothetical protein
MAHSAARAAGWLAAAFFAAGVASEARADGQIDGAIIGGEVVAMIAPTVTLVGNSIVLGVVDRPGFGWPIAGLICGGLGLGGGIALMAGSPQGYGKIYKPLMIGGAVLAGISLADIVVSSVVIAKGVRSRRDAPEPAPSAAWAPVPVLAPGLVGVEARGWF